MLKINKKIFLLLLICTTYLLKVEIDVLSILTFMCSRKQTIRQLLYKTKVKALNLKILFCFVTFTKTNNVVLVKCTKCNINVCIERSNTLRHNTRLNVMEVILTSGQGISNMIRNIKYFTELM